MHIVNQAFLWLNRTYFLGLVLFHLLGNRFPEGVTKEHRMAQFVISVWQLVGTVLVQALRRSPFHLVWWYVLGWGLYAVCGAIYTDLKRLRSR